MKINIFADRGFILNTPQLKSDLAHACQCPGITGVMKLLRWRDIEPTPGAYDFSSVDEHLAIVAEPLELGFGILPGVFCPSWLTTTLGCSFVALTATERRGGQPILVRYPNPTDPIYAQRLLMAHQALANHLEDADALGRVSNMRATPCCSNDDEACCLAVDAGRDRIDAMWAAAGFRPSAFEDFWCDFIGDLQGIWPGATLSLPFLDPSIDFPRVSDAGDVFTHDTWDLVTDLVNVSGYIAIMQNTISAAPLSERILEMTGPKVTLYGQMNDWGGTGGAIPSKGAEPSAEGFQAILDNARAAGVQVLEIHQVDAENENYWQMISAAAKL